MPQPRPVRLVDWGLGGACGGLLLGGAELLAEGPAGWRYPPPLALLLISSTGLLGTASGALVGLVVHALGVRMMRAGLVGGMIGPVLLLGAAPVWRGLTLAGALQLAAGLAAAGLLSWSAARGASTGGAAGRPASPGLTWAGAALVFAGVVRLLAPGLAPVGWLAVACVPLGLVLAVAGLSGLAFRRGGALPSLPRLLALLAAAALAASFFPWLLPWLLLERDLPQPSPWPPGFLIVALDAPQSVWETGREEAIPSVELLAVDSLAYDVHPRPALASLLRLPDGSLLPSALKATGYATAAIVTDPTRPPRVEVDHRDGRPGGRRLLEEAAGWMAGARLLLGPGSALASLAGQGGDLRSPPQLGAEASRWLLRWRTQRAQTPFFLLVDFRAPGADAAALDASFTQLLDTLWELQLNATTLLIVAIEGGGERAGQAILVPPQSWPRIPPQAALRAWGPELGLALLGVARSDGSRPPVLPGLAGGIAPPAPLEPW